MSHPSDISFPRAISLLIPVFRDLHVTRRCLESVLSSNLPDDVSVTVINDGSPEPELSAYCREIASTTRVKLVVNEHNLGFVKSANRGFELESEADIVLLNSDTIVSGDWLQRMRSCAYRQPDIGTVTPFSNNGTICSYPVISVANNLPFPWTPAELDEAFRKANIDAYSEIPTAVGFCMYIKRNCLNETGLFDETNFGHGYGEECDFSMRASAKGWKHMVAANVFVFHEGGASFASESTDRKRRADKVMNELHPHYHQEVNQFLQSDPLATYRRNVDAIRINAKPLYSDDILDEHMHYARILLDWVRELQGGMLAEQAQRTSLQRMLDDCREQFATTDRVLSEAQYAYKELASHLDGSREYAEQLKRHINYMEQSRSWRYTAWLRRK